MTPYRSSRAALADAARLSAALDVRPRREVRVQRTATEDRQDGPIAVRAALRAAGLDPDGAEVELLYSWAVDELEVEEGSELADRLEALLGRVATALEVAGVVARRPTVTLLRVAWRVVELDGQRLVHLVTDPPEGDPTIYPTPEAAQAVVDGHVEGAVHVSEEISPAKRLHPELAEAWWERWTAGEFASVGDLDHALASAERWSPRHAKRVRKSWGIRLEGHRPKAATRPHCDAALAREKGPS